MTTKTDNEILAKGFRLNQLDEELMATPLSAARVTKEEFFDALGDALFKTVYYRMSQLSGLKSYHVLTKGGIMVSLYEKG